jgi:hypothetical protein
MGKAFGLLLLVLGIYVGAEIYMGNAPFGIGAKTDGKEAASQTTVQRAGSKVEAAFESGNARRDALIPE